MSKREQVPLRRCVACRRTAPKNEFIRLTRSGERGVQIDSTGQATGRGAYVCPNVTCVQNALKRRAFERALKTKIPEETIEALKQMELTGEQG